jgi:hypothetical protein
MSLGFALAALTLVGVEPLNDPTTLVEIQVSGDADYTIAHSIIISSVERTALMSRQDLEARRWIALRRSERGQDTVTSEQCGAVKEAALAFGDLPPIPMITLANRIDDESEPLQDIILHGFSTRVRFNTPHMMRVETVGGSSIRLWAHNTVSNLMSCWDPLTPEGSRFLGN